MLDFIKRFDFCQLFVPLRMVVLMIACSYIQILNQATVLHCQTNRPQKIKQKMHHIGCIFYLTGCGEWI